LATQNQLKAMYPQHSEIINKFTRQ
jgi:hypothetical protein